MHDCYIYGCPQRPYNLLVHIKKGDWDHRPDTWPRLRIFWYQVTKTNLQNSEYDLLDDFKDHLEWLRTLISVVVNDCEGCMRKDLVEFWLTLKTFLDDNLSYAAKWEHDAFFFLFFQICQLKQVEAYIGQMKMHWRKCENETVKIMSHLTCCLCV